MKTKTCIIAIGNRFRADDAIGPILLDQIKDQLPPQIDTFEETGDVAKLLDLFQNYECVYIMDAVATNNVMPGTLHCLDAYDDNLVKETLHTSTHAFSVHQAIELAKNLNIMPKQCIIFGIEGSDFGFDSSMSELLTQKIPTLTQTLLDAITRS